MQLYINFIRAKYRDTIRIMKECLVSRLKLSRFTTVSFGGHPESFTLDALDRYTAATIANVLFAFSHF